jgi:hypothetical protein
MKEEMVMLLSQLSLLPTSSEWLFLLLALPVDSKILSMLESNKRLPGGHSSKPYSLLSSYRLSQ